MSKAVELLSEFQQVQPLHSHAYCTLVMKGDAYVGGALVLAHSLRQVAVDADIVCMITSDVSDAGCEALLLLFDHVVLVEYIDAQVLPYPGKRFKQLYAWISLAFTKLRVLELVNYDRVVLLDADMLASRNPDALFAIHTPAGICSILRKAEDLSFHGKPIPVDIVKRSISDYGIRGCCYVFNPKEQGGSTEVDAILRRIDPAADFGERGKYIGPDEQIITEHYMEKWTHVSHSFGCPTWKEGDLLADGEKAVVFHYVSEKPWKTNQEWPEFAWWDDVAKLVFEKHPQTLRYFVSRAWAKSLPGADQFSSADLVPQNTRVAFSEERLKQEESSRRASSRHPSSSSSSFSSYSSSSSSHGPSSRSDTGAVSGSWRSASNSGGNSRNREPYRDRDRDRDRDYRDRDRDRNRDRDRGTDRDREGGGDSWRRTERDYDDRDERYRRSSRDGSERSGRWDRRGGYDGPESARNWRDRARDSDRPRSRDRNDPY
eukprot:ANDGO_05839.mRNA.1 Uncharacterized protein R707